MRANGTANGPKIKMPDNENSVQVQYVSSILRAYVSTSRAVNNIIFAPSFPLSFEC